MSSSTRWHRRALASVGTAATAMLVLGPVDVAGSSTATEGQPTDPPTLTANLSPTLSDGRGDLTYSSVDPCPMVEGVRLSFEYWDEATRASGQEDAMPIHDGEVEVEEDGSWSTVMPAPPGGRYEILASCVTSEEDPDDGFPGPVEVSHGDYSEIDFEVIPDLSEDPNTNTPTPDPSPTTTAPASPAQPARPVPAQPNFTG